MFSCLGEKENVVLCFSVLGSQLSVQQHFSWTRYFRRLLGKCMLLLLCCPGPVQALRSASPSVKCSAGGRGGKQCPIMGNANPSSFLLLLFVWRWLKTEKWGWSGNVCLTEFSMCWPGTVGYQDMPGVEHPQDSWGDWISHMWFNRSKAYNPLSWPWQGVT